MREIVIWRTGTDAPLGSPSGGAGCPARGRLRGPAWLDSAAMILLRYPLSQPVRLTALPKGEPRGAAILPAKLQFSVQKRYRALPGSPGEHTGPVRHCLPRLAAKFPLELRVPGGIIKEEKEDNISTNRPKAGFGGHSSSPPVGGEFLFGQLIAKNSAGSMSWS